MQHDINLSPIPHNSHTENTSQRKYMGSVKPKATIMLGLFFSTTVLSADLPALIDRQSANQEIRIGMVSVSRINGSSDDAVRNLQQKSAEIGGSKLRIISLSTSGDSSHWMGSAEVYR